MSLVDSESDGDNIPNLNPDGGDSLQEGSIDLSSDDENKKEGEG